MPPHASWKSLGTGILSLSAVIGAALLILIFGRVGSLRGKAFTLYITTDAARGLSRGSDVWLDGQRVGTVQDIRFQSPTSASSERLMLVVRILEQVKSQIRRDSRVQIASGGSILGAPVVQVSSGTIRQPPIHEGDTLRAIEQPDREGLTSDFAIASREFPGIIANVKVLGSQIKGVEGTLGALMGEDLPSLRPVRATAARLADRVHNPNGSIGMALRGRDSLRARAAGAIAQVDSMRALLASDRHSLGRFRRDSTIKIQLVRIRAEIVEVRKLVRESDGAVGRLRGDSAIVVGIHRGLRSIDSLMADFKKHPLRYIAF